MIHIAICDDDIKTIGNAEHMILELGKSLNQKIEVSIFHSGEEFCDRLVSSDEPFDIVLMDIEMGDITGVDAGRNLRADIQNRRTLLIYISSHNNYYEDIINLNAFCFISKPFHIGKFKLRLTNALENVIYQRQYAPFPDFSFKKNREEVFVPIKSVMFLESKLRIIYLHTTQKTYDYYGNLNIEEKKLQENMFCRIHNSFLVCFTHITSITARDVTISGRVLPISAKNRNIVKQAYSRYREMRL